MHPVDGRIDDRRASSVRSQTFPETSDRFVVGTAPVLEKGRHPLLEILDPAEVAAPVQYYAKAPRRVRLVRGELDDEDILVPQLVPKLEYPEI